MELTKDQEKEMLRKVNEVLNGVKEVLKLGNRLELRPSSYTSNSWVLKISDNNCQVLLLEKHLPLDGSRKQRREAWGTLDISEAGFLGNQAAIVCLVKGLLNL